MKEYKEKLFEENGNKVNLGNMQGDEGRDIMKDEVSYVLRHLKNGKAVGPDQLPTEILKLIEEKQLQIYSILSTKQELYQMLYFGHLIRGERYHLLQNIMQGKIAGKRSVEKRRHSWLKNLRDWYSFNNNNLFRAAVSKIKIALIIANLRNEDGI